MVGKASLSRYGPLHLHDAPLNGCASVTKGAYTLGADSGNILVQNRLTGQLQEEKMQIYVRLGIRLGYRGMTGVAETNRSSY